MKKHIVILLFLIPLCTSAYSQDRASRNVLRGGAALLLHRQNNYIDADTFFPGSQFQIEYSQRFTHYFSLDATLFNSNMQYSSLQKWRDTGVPLFTNETTYGVSIKGIFTPIKAIKWLKIGAGGFAEYSITYNSVENYEYSSYRRRNMFYGINIPLRFYIIDSNKFDLYAYYEYVARIDGSNFKEITYYSLHDIFGVMFGVKF